VEEVAEPAREAPPQLEPKAQENFELESHRKQ
jgi:hypothetical protein